MSKFEDRLWSELVLDHGPQLAAMPRMEIPSHSRRGPIAVGAVALAGALAAVALTATTGPSPSDAYSVSQSSNGSVNITIRELSGVSGANAQLARLHVRVRVATVEANCSATGEIAPISPPPILPPIVSDLVHHEGESFVVRPDLVPRGDFLVISARELGQNVGLSYAFYRGSAPPCVRPGDSNVG
jgi:hypothetical protein